MCTSLQAQLLERVHFFPDSAYVSAFTADVHEHKMQVENILLTRNERATMGGIFRILNIDLLGTTVQGSLGASVHFELQPLGQAHIISNDYYVDYLILDIPIREKFFARIVTGHTSHHLSDNWYERLKLTTAFRYSRDYVRLFAVHEQNANEQWYIGMDYAYIFTVGKRTTDPWTFQAGGKYPFGTVWDLFTMYASFDSKIRQEAGFAATNAVQFGLSVPMQYHRLVRIFLQYRKGLDDRGQFIPQHREVSTIGISFE